MSGADKVVFAFPCQQLFHILFMQCRLFQRGQILPQQQHLARLQLVARIDTAADIVDIGKASGVVTADRNNADLASAQVDDIPVVQDVDFIIRMGHRHKAFLHLLTKRIFGVFGGSFAHPGLFPEGVSAGMVKMAMGIADHDRLVGDCLNKCPEVAVTVSGVDQHCLFAADQQIAVEAAVIADHPGIGEVLPFTVDISVFVDIGVCHCDHPFRQKCISFIR